jgi:hypothetical protein
LLMRHLGLASPMVDSRGYVASRCGDAI